MCYRFELIEFEDCIFENIDATYIIHLEGNGRINHIFDQLKKYHPSKKVYIVFNKGYKNCEKDLARQRTIEDLVDANMTIFEHAQQYKNVLVLEDDFIFSEDIKKHSTHVDEFLKREDFVYQLGSVPFLAYPIDMYHWRVYGLTSHANIYSPSSRTLLLDHYRDNNASISHIDYYIATVLPVYMYYKPLCYQTFPMTENRKRHTENYSPLMSYIIKTIFDTFISWTNLENEPTKGFAIMYFCAKSFLFLLLFILLWIIRTLFYKKN
jgi:hypothetical protein